MTEWLTREEARAYIKSPSLQAFDWWAKSRGVRAEGQRGRMPLYTKRQLDAALRFEATRRTSARLHPKRRSA
jgi:hypothetical protein